MQPAQGLHVEWVDDEAVVLDPDSHELHYLNTSAALVYALILEHGYETAMRRLKADYRNASGFDKEVELLVEDLVGKGLLVDG
jgi:hypothetical protein